jgi:hypothetical protein
MLPACWRHASATNPGGEPIGNRHRTGVTEDQPIEARTMTARADLVDFVVA